MNDNTKAYALGTITVVSIAFCLYQVGGVTVDHHNSGVVKANTARRDAIAKELLGTGFLGFRELERLEASVARVLTTINEDQLGAADSPKRANLLRKISALLRANLTADPQAYLRYRYPERDAAGIEFAPGYRELL